MKIHYFNPENDLALAANTPFYTAPAKVRAMHDAGALLPLWFAESDDIVICHGVNAKWLSRISSDFGIKARPSGSKHSLGALCPKDIEPAPWGWSACAKRDFLLEGVPEDALPSDDAIYKMRILSHRRTAAEIAQLLQEAFPDIPMQKPALEVFTEQDAALAIGMMGNAVVKAPWSGSGRGVANSVHTGLEKAVKTAEDAIRRQGSAMIEPALDKALDFAKIFVCEGGKCRFHSTSVFTTDARGAYTGNLLAPESERRQVLASFSDDLLDRTDAIAECLQELLSQKIAPYYNGVVGVDMLVDKSGLLAPVVEINLRNTMGYLANEFARRYLAPGSVGNLIAVPTAALTETVTAPLTDKATAALPETATAVLPETATALPVIESGQLVCGSLPLTPSSSHFTFRIDTHRKT